MSFFNLSCVPILTSLQLQHEMAVESAWIFDMDCYYQTLILARRIFVMGGTHMLKKVKLLLKEVDFILQHIHSSLSLFRTYTQLFCS